MGISIFGLLLLWSIYFTMFTVEAIVPSTVTGVNHAETTNTQQSVLITEPEATYDSANHEGTFDVESKFSEQIKLRVNHTETKNTQQQFDDVGIVNRISLCDEVRKSLSDFHFRPTRSYPFRPQVQKSGKQLFFQVDWLDTFPHFLGWYFPRVKMGDIAYHVSCLQLDPLIVGFVLGLWLTLHSPIFARLVVRRMGFWTIMSF